MTIDHQTQKLRALPSVDLVLRAPELVRAQEVYGRELVRVQVRRDLESLREGVMKREELLVEEELESQPDRVLKALERDYGKPLQRVLNATGILLHTNLGRAPLPREVASRLPELLNAYCDLEFDLDTGVRLDRNHRASSLLAALTGAPAALVVNNNAAAIVLALKAWADGAEVIVSRGELVEIGGSFRIPELLEAVGVRLVEVGSTNRTTIADYERAVGPETALLLKVYPSNYRQTGYVASVAPGELVALSRRCAVPVLVDEGSGLLRSSNDREQLRGHPSLGELIAEGCDLACGSGDKLLGGPQAGLLVGSTKFVKRCRKHPLYRALRPDVTSLAALESVLRLHLAGGDLPLDRLWPEPESYRERLQSAATKLGARVVPADAFLGGGSAPDRPVPGFALALPDAPDLAAEMRKGVPPVIGYSRGGRFMLDLRTVDPEDDEALIGAVLAAQATVEHATRSAESRSK